MKILCVSDLIDPMIYNTNASENFPDIDLILCAGDLPMDYIDFIVSVFNKPTYFVFGNHNLEEFSYYHPSVQASSSSSSQHISHPSFNSENNNHNHGAVYAGFKNIVDKNFIVYKKNGKPSPLLITGTSGSIRYNNGLCQYTDFQMKMHLLALVPGLLWNKIRYGRFTDIFLTHATPYHVHDKDDPCHVGFKSFNWFVKKFKPIYMIHGHIHLYDLREERVSSYENSTIVNAYAHHVLDFKNTL